MSFDDDNRERTPHRTTALLFTCQRCRALHEEPHPTPEVEIRRMVESGQLHTMHTCDDGGTGCCRLIGTGPGRPRATEAA